MPYNYTSQLWPDREDRFFQTDQFYPMKQEGPHCVATSLAIISGTTAQQFYDKINTQDPVSWSTALRSFGKKLAYCPTDVRKLRFYMEELIEIDDLFTLSYYTAQDSSEILHDPDERGWICSSHIVVLHRNVILDPASGIMSNAFEHECNRYHTKRIFRVIPSEHRRGL